ncbi:uncharacterized protein LOC109020358 [Juglans regia]|uniref:Uncharacterized protein LOC109020358 n=1 Tax=Juglans regia TaxID=51240 RepID=A0A6P9EFS0_JUGRE|nr:uncharacterized protein LOC109020358 [Juglans regia]
MYNRIGNEEISFFVETARTLWLRRNHLVFEGDLLSPASVFTRSQQTQQKFIQTQLLDRVPQRPQQQQVRTSWKAPSADWLKINWYVAVREVDHRIGIGVVIRYNEGDVLFTLRQSLYFCSQPSTAEAMGLVTVALLCMELELKQVILEGDSSHVVNAMRQGKDHNGMLSCLVEDAKAALKKTNWEIQHVKREANKVAHYLAQEAVSLD